MSSCPGTFAVAKNPNNALIWPVQFCLAISLLWRRLKKSIVQGGLRIEAGRQVGHWECDTENGAIHKGAVVTMVERKSGYNKVVKLEKKTAELVSSAIVDKLKPLVARVKR